MRHKSVPVEGQICEFINVQPMNPLISKCQIKVCYVSDKPNRNRSIITKDVARELANSLPGSPIVGYYNSANGDFEEHNRSITISNGKFDVEDATRPYGFVDMNAKCWFQKFIDDDAVEREYLLTEGYIWTGQYPETRRIIDRGNNQSMELDEKTLNASWTKDENGKPKFFIINEAVISKLCILGEECEPCFEGSNITPIQFSFSDNFQNEMLSMMKELKEYLLNEGGTPVLKNSENNEVLDNVDTSVELQDSSSQAPDTSETEFKKKEEDEKTEGKDDKSDKPETEDKSEGEKTPEDKKSDESTNEKKEDEKSEDKSDEEDKKKKKYTLEEIPEYVELTSRFSELETKYNALLEENAQLKTDIEPLRQFKSNEEKKQKQAMIDSFCMLSDEDKKDVVEHIDTYSLDDIEAKLSIICVRNKVNFNLDDDRTNIPTVYNVNNEDIISNSSIPAWIKKATEVAATLN